MKVVISAGISPILRYPHDGFINCFESYGNMFAKFGHDVWYVGLPAVQQNIDMILSADLWMSEFNTFYVPLYLMILESGKMQGKTWFVQHGSFDELDSYSIWALRAIDKADCFIINTIGTKRILENIVSIPIYDDIPQPIDDRLFALLGNIPKENRILLGHIAGRIVVGHLSGNDCFREDTRRHLLFAASIFKNYPLKRELGAN